MRRLKISFYTVACLLFSLPWSAMADDHRLIDVAGSQGVLIQQMLKSYCQIGIGEVYGEPERQLEQAIARHEELITILEDATRDEAEEWQALQQVIARWPEYKQKVQEAPSHEGARLLLELSSDMLEANHELIEALEESAASEHAETVDLAGRERILSQRMAMYYMLKLWGVEEQAISRELEATSAEFVSILEKLESLPENSSTIDRLLRRVRHSLNLLEHSMAYKKENLSFTVALTTDLIIKAMDQVTAEYVSLATASSSQSAN